VLVLTRELGFIVFVYRNIFEVGDCLSRAKQRVFFTAATLLILFLEVPLGVLENDVVLQAFFAVLGCFLLFSCVQWFLIFNRMRYWHTFEPILYCLDLPLLTVGLALAGPYLFFASPLLAVVALVRGVRYGPVSLATHSIFSFLAFAGLGFWVPYWHQNLNVIFVNLFLLAVMPFYFYTVSLKIHQSSRNLKEENLRDPLTRAFNRKALDAALWRMLGARKPFVLSFFDLDNFKLVNDTLGHAMGDKLLRRICAKLTIRLRGDDQLFRLSGDEFVVLSPVDLKSVAAASLGERIRVSILEVIDQTCPQTQVSASVGVLVVNTYDGFSGSDLLQHADELMYRAKRSGKNQVLVEMK
jgi:diguanylate cyclase (GGDEF)-like protein